MDNGLYSAAGAMRSGEKRLETIAHNLANVSTRGFKRGTTFEQAVKSVRGGDLQVVAGLAPDASQGPLESTGNPFDLALDGRGWFAIDEANGRSYTRDGSFKVDDRGTLVTQDGRPVAWKGAGGVLRPTGKPVTVDARGAVRQGDAVIGELEVVDFADASRLTPNGNGRFTAPSGALATASPARVRQGAVERSNVESMDELVALVAVQRGFESAATAMRTIEQSYNRLNQPR
jgi:flagellar basal-body rod protein FlgF